MTATANCSLLMADGQHRHRIMATDIWNATTARGSLLMAHARWPPPPPHHVKCKPYKSAHAQYEIMITTRPNADPEARYSAAQAAALLGIARQSIYRYLKGHVRKCNGRKYFTGQEILELWEDADYLQKQKEQERQSIAQGQE